jgi:hypothetical protein
LTDLNNSLIVYDGTQMEIFKSSRHSKITGDFAEALVLYWLSKYGFECARVDHTGIDLIARNPHTRELIGISVKSRCRVAGDEGSYVRVLAEDFRKAKQACRAFGCIPHFAIVVDGAETIRVFLTPLKHFLRLSRLTERTSGWRMGHKALALYRSDPEVKMFEFTSKTYSWWRKQLLNTKATNNRRP